MGKVRGLHVTHLNCWELNLHMYKAGNLAQVYTIVVVRTFVRVYEDATSKSTFSSIFLWDKGKSVHKKYHENGRHILQKSVGFIVGTDIYAILQSLRPCLLRRESAIAHHYTPKMALKSVIFSTPKFSKVVHN